MRRWQRASIWGLAIVAVGTAVAADRETGYLAPGEFDVTHVLEPAPQPGDPRYEADRRIFRSTRKLIGSPRWALATSDAELGTAALLRDFSCAVGVQLTPDHAPRLVNVLQRASSDTGRETNEAKEFYRRQRPFTIDRGQICQRESALYDFKAQRMSYDYPSGHTTRGWTYALVLSSLAPDRARQIMERGRAFGDSRFICGAHNESAVEAGMLSASATMAVVAAKPDYQADLAAARTELETLRASPTPPEDCAAEAARLQQPLMPGRDPVR